MSQEKFQQHFKSVYADRWPALYQALLEKETQVARRSLWTTDNLQTGTQLFNQEDSRLFDCECLDADFAAQRCGEESLLTHYVMDPASVLAARSLPLKTSDRVLDMCAAPGGKTLILLQQLSEGGELIANDLSADRRERLKKVIQQYVPRDVRNQVWVKGQDAVQYGLKEADAFDAVLLDAPCSGERHVLENQKAIAEWSVKRSQNLAIRQYSMLCAALLAVKSNGYILYSTCSISPLENDEVIQKLIKKKSDSFEVIETQPSQFLEATRFGQIALPDKCGFGPLYFCLLRKR